MADVKVESIKYHTTAGKEYPVGATYTVDESAVDNLVAQGMALRVDRADVAKAQAAAAAKTAKAAKPAKPARVSKPRAAKVGAKKK